MGPIARCKQPTAHAVRPRVDNRGLPGMVIGGGGRKREVKTASQASSFQPVSADRSSYRYLVRTLSLMAMPLWPGAKRAGRQKALVGEVKEAKEAENSPRVDTGVTIAPFDGNLLRARRADDTLHDKNGNAVGSWPLAVGCW